MELYIDTGDKALAGIYPFTVECSEEGCERCPIRFSCYTQNKEVVHYVDFATWFEFLRANIKWQKK